METEKFTPEGYKNDIEGEENLEAQIESKADEVIENSESLVEELQSLKDTEDTNVENRKNDLLYTRIRDKRSRVASALLSLAFGSFSGLAVYAIEMQDLLSKIQGPDPESITRNQQGFELLTAISAAAAIGLMAKAVKSHRRIKEGNELGLKGKE